MAWNKTLPSGGVSLNIGDDKIRDNMDALDDALSREHTFPGVMGSTAGRHSFPAVADQTAMVAIANQVNGMIAGVVDHPTLYQRHSGAFLSMQGCHYMTTAARTGLTTSLLTPGFTVIDSNSGKRWFWNGSAWELEMRDMYSYLNVASAAEQAISLDFSAPDLITGLDRTITPPTLQGGYEIKVHANMRCYTKGNKELMFWLEENVNGAGNTERDVAFFNSDAGETWGDVELNWLQQVVVTGQTHQYRVYGARKHADALVNPNETILNGVGSTTFWSKLEVQLRRRQT
jgi:hypothetical protein